LGITNAGALSKTHSHQNYSDWCAMVYHYPTTTPQSTPMPWTLALSSDTIRCNDASSLPSVKNTGYRVRVVHYGVLLSRIAGSRELAGVAGEKRAVAAVGAYVHQLLVSLAHASTSVLCTTAGFQRLRRLLRPTATSAESHDPREGADVKDGCLPIAVQILYEQLSTPHTHGV
jgi:hypothetical protein